MKKFTIALFGLILMNSCSSDNNLQNRDESKEMFTTSQKEITFDNNKAYGFTFNYNYGKNTANFNMQKEKENIFSLDMDRDGKVDFLVELLNEKGTEFYYLLPNGKRISKGIVHVEKDGYGKVEILETYNDDKILSARGGTMDCFEKTMGSSHGIIGGFVVSFMGPWATGTYMAAIAGVCWYEYGRVEVIKEREYFEPIYSVGEVKRAEWILN